MMLLRPWVLLSLSLAWASEWGQEESIPELMARLEDEDPQVRQTASMSLKAMGEKARPALAEAATGTGERSARAKAILNWLEWKALIPDYLTKNCPDVADRLASGSRRSEYVREGSPIPFAAIPKLILESDLSVGWRVLSRFEEWNLDESVAVPRSVSAAILTLLRRWPRHVCSPAHLETHQEYLAVAGHVLARGTDERDIPALRGLLETESVELVVTAAAALISLGDRPEKPLIALLSSDGWVRSSAIDLLAALRSGGAVRPLISLLSSKDVRTRAAWALDQIGDSTAAAALESELLSGRVVETAFCRALLRLDPAAAARTFTELASKDDTFSPPVVEGLLRTQGESPLGLIIGRVAKSSNPAWRQSWWQMEELPLLQDAGNIQRLMEVARIDDPLYRLSEACLKCSNREVVASVARRLLAESPDPHVQIRAFACLRRDDPRNVRAMRSWADRILLDSRHEGFDLAARYLMAETAGNVGVVTRVLQRSSAFDLLPSFAAPSDVDRLWEVVKRPPPADRARLWALRALWRRGEERGRYLVKEALGDGELNADALRAMAEERAPEVIKDLERGFEQAPTKATSHQIATYCIPELSEALRRQGLPDHRLDVLLKLWTCALPETSRESLLDELCWWWGEEESVRSLLRGLCRQDSKLGTLALRRLLDQGDASAVGIAEEARRIEAKRTLPIAGSLLLSTDPQQRIRGLRAMAICRECEHLTSVLSLARLDHPRVKREAVRTLAALGRPEAIQTLLEILRDLVDDVGLATEVASALEALGDASWRSEIQALLKMPSRSWKANLILAVIDQPPVFLRKRTGSPWPGFDRDPARAFGEWAGLEVVVSSDARAYLEGGPKRPSFVQPTTVFELLEHLFSEWKDLACVWSNGQLHLQTRQELLRSSGSMPKKE